MARAVKKVRNLEDLVPDPKNARSRTKRGKEMIANSFREVGPARSIVIDEQAVVLAGNGALEGAIAAGIKKLRIIDTDGDELIAVRRRGLSKTQKTKLAIYDNRTGELAEWDWSQLAKVQDGGLQLQPWFTDEELAAGIGKTVKFGAGKKGAPATIEETYQVLVTCKSEREQARLLARFTKEGLACRALMS